ncbi:MAG: PAS domain-containing sensor histidine kinase [Nitriliruptorales bacterium]
MRESAGARVTYVDRVAALLGLAAIVVILPFSEERSVPLLVAAGIASLPFLTLWVERYGRAWMTWPGLLYSAAWIALLIAATGGAHSPYVFLYAVFVIVAAMTNSAQGLLVAVSFAAPAALLPVAYAGFDRGFVQDVVIGGAVWAMVAAIVHAGVVRLRWSEERARTAAAAARESEQRFRLLADNADDVVYLMRFEPELAFEYLSPATERITGFTPDELLANPEIPVERTHPDDRPGLIAVRTHPELVRGPVTFRFHHRDGDWRWLEERLTPVRDAEGRVVGVQGIVRDVSVHKQAEGSLRAALERERAAAEKLKSVDELKTSFLQAVSHELRTPLAALLGYSMTLRSRREQLAEQQVQEMLERLVFNAEKLNRMLSDLLDVERLSQGEVVALRGEVDLGELVRRVVRESDLEEGRVALDLEALTARVDAAMVERLVDNLLRNAGKHTPPGTPVTVRLRRDGDSAHLTVEDAGRGVPDSTKARVFEPFQQGQEALRSHSPGTGIGLALVARLAALHGGEAWVDDRPGGGARFHVRLQAGTSRESVSDAESDVGRLGR